MNNSTPELKHIASSRKVKHIASLSYTVLCLADCVTKKIKIPLVQSIHDAPPPQEESTESKQPPKKRQAVTEFSASSRRRLVKYTREVPKNRFSGFVTLTYPTAPNVKDSKEHINQFLEYMRRYAGKTKQFSALWVMEFQERGAVHYHVWTNAWIPKGRITTAWNRIINEPATTPSTNVRAWKAYSKSGLSSYVAKYARKQAQKELPEGVESAGRWWGKVGDVSTPLAIKTEVTQKQRNELIDEAERVGWKEIKIDWGRLFIVNDDDRHALFEKLKEIKLKNGGDL